MNKETQFKIGHKQYNTGRTHFKKGIIPWNKGKKGCYSNESLKKMSKSKKGIMPSNINVIAGYWRGKKRKEIYITDESKYARQSLEYRLWREAVYSRDRYECQKCNVIGGKLHPHHIKNFCSHKELRFSIDNGITLCVVCHKKFHHIYGNRKNNIEQIKKYVAN